MESSSNLITKLESGLPWVRKRALNNLVKLGSFAVKEIITALDTPYASDLLKAISSTRPEEFNESIIARKIWPFLIDALVQIGKPALEELENSLNHPNPNVRISAMVTIGKIGHPSAVDILLPFLESIKSYERAWAIVALGHTRSSRVYEIIVSALENETIDQDSIITAFGALGDTRALPRLEKIAASHKKLDGRYGFEKRTVVNEAIKSIQKENER